MEESGEAIAEINSGELSRNIHSNSMVMQATTTNSNSGTSCVRTALHIKMQVDEIRVDLRAEQYEQILLLKDSFVALSNWQAFFPYRPKASPLQDPRAWWRCEKPDEEHRFTDFHHVKSYKRRRCFYRIFIHFHGQRRIFVSFILRGLLLSRVRHIYVVMRPRRCKGGLVIFQVPGTSTSHSIPLACAGNFGRGRDSH